MDNTPVVAASRDLDGSSAPMPVRKFLDCPDGKLSYLEWCVKPGLPALHFAHANGFNGMTYRQLLSPLAPYFHIRAWDARGHGMSSLTTNPAAHKNWHIYRDDLVRMSEDFAAANGGPVILAGHSLGGAASIMAAGARPDLVRALCLVDPVMVTLFQRFMFKTLGLLLGKGLSADLAGGAQRRRALWPDRETMIKAYQGRGAFRSWPVNVIADYVEGGTKAQSDGTITLACAPEWEAANFRAHGHNVYAAINELRCPLTLIYAGADTTCRAPAPTRLQAHDPQATILRIGRASHFLPMEFPDVVRREMLDLEARLQAMKKDK